MSYDFAQIASGTTAVVVAAQGAGVRIRVLAAMVAQDTTMSAHFVDGNTSTATKLAGGPRFEPGGGFVLDYNPAGWFETDTNTALGLAVGTTGAADVNVTWIQAA